MTFRRGNESERTYQLKWAAWEWLYSRVGCRSIAFEVALEGPGGRIVDVAALDRDNALYVVEVKASRSDFRRDDHDGVDVARLYEREQALQRMAEVAKEVVARAPLDQQATLDMALVERQIAHHADRTATFSTKFHDPRFLRVADYNYIMAPKNAVRRADLPPFWGLLDPSAKVVIDAPRTGGSRPTYMLANVLRAIARANTRDMMRGYGVRWRERSAFFPTDATGRE